MVKSEISAVMSEAPGEDDFGGGGDEEDDEDSFQLEEGFEASGGGDEDYGDDYGGSEMDPIAGTSADGADGAKGRTRLVFSLLFAIVLQDKFKGLHRTHAVEVAERKNILALKIGLMLCRQPRPRTAIAQTQPFTFCF